MSKKVLIIRLGAIGDVVHSTIMAEAIKKRHSDVEIHYLTVKMLKPLLEFSPYIDKIHTIDVSKKNNLFYLLKLAFTLRKEKFDVIFNLTNSFRNIFISKMCWPKKLVKRSCNRKHAVDAFFNTANDYFGDLEKPENLTLVVPDNLKNEIRARISDYPAPYFIFNPGGANDCERQGRIWAIEDWKELGKKLVEKYGGSVFVCGAKSECVYHQELSEMPNSIIFTGQLSLENSVALYSIADCFVSGDSGPLHIASALDIKTIGLMGSTPPVSCRPYGDNGYYIEPYEDCRYCCRKKCEKLAAGEKIAPCMKSITVNKVVEFIDSILSLNN